MEPSRLFVPFIDPADMVMCCPADMTIAEINRDANCHGLRFPLMSDPKYSLRDHLATSDFAAASARFGPYVDNVLGINWTLPSGQIVRIGERVIKSTTGYDLVRFLLHTDGRYGEAKDVVLRLRSFGGDTVRAIFRGHAGALDSLRASLLRSPWIHWFDTVNLTYTGMDRTELHIVIDCAETEIMVYKSRLDGFGREFGLTVSYSGEHVYTGLPVLSLKATVTTAPSLALTLVQRHGGTAQVLCVNGVVHYFPAFTTKPLTPAIIADLSLQCTKEGGHVMGTWATSTLPAELETCWAQSLETAWQKL